MTSTRGRRLEADARREQLLSCAAQLFAERPYAQVSTTELAERAGIARGLLNHYFGTKRELYVEVVRRMLAVPPVEAVQVTGSLRARVERGVDWFLEAVGTHGQTFLAITGTGGLGDDPDIEALLDEADDQVARRVLEVVGLDAGDARQRALVRAYGGLAKAAVREWQRSGALTRDDVHRLLTRELLTLVKDVLPE